MNLNFNIATIEQAGKITPVLEHEFTPLKDNKELVIVCDYLTSGERTKLIGFGVDSIAELDMKKIFSMKVKSIKGLNVSFNGKDKTAITTAEQLLALPSTNDTEAIVMSTVLHLANNESLTGDEVKN